METFYARASRRAGERVPASTEWEHGERERERERERGGGRGSGGKRREEGERMLNAIKI